MTVSEARNRLPDVLDRVTEGEEITITRHGQPVAVVVRPEMLRARRTDALSAVTDDLKDRLARAGEARRPGKGLTASRAKALAAEVRVARDRR